MSPSSSFTPQLRPLSVGEVLDAFLERREQLAPPARAAIAGELAQRLRTRVGGAQPELEDERFLELLAAAKAARR